MPVSQMTCCYYQNYDNYFVYEHDFGFGGTASEHFHFQNKETLNMLVHNTQPNYSFICLHQMSYTCLEGF